MSKIIAIKQFKKWCRFLARTSILSIGSVTLLSFLMVESAVGETQVTEVWEVWETEKLSRSDTSESGNQFQEATTFIKLGTIYQTLGVNTLALEEYSKALKVYQALGDRAQEALVLTQMGDVYLDNLEVWDREELLKLIHQISIHSNWSKLQLDKSESDRENAKNVYAQALEIYREVGDRLAEANTLIIIAENIYLNQGEEDQLQRLEQALEIYQELGDRLGEAKVLSQLSRLHLIEWHNDKTGLELLDRARKIYQELANDSDNSDDFATKQGEADALQIPINYWWNVNLNQALALHEERLMLYREIGDRQGEALALYTLANYYSRSDRNPQALENYQQALIIYQTLEQPIKVFPILNQMGEIYTRLGNSEKALEFYQKELEILAKIERVYRQFADPQHQLYLAYRQSNLWLIVAGIYHELNDSEKELEAYNQARTIYNIQGDRQGESNLILSIVERYGNPENIDWVTDWFDRAIELYQNVGDRPGEAELLSHRIASIYFYHPQLKNTEKGVKIVEQALQIYQDIGDKIEEGKTLEKLGRFYVQELDDRPKALSFYDRSVSLYRQLGDRDRLSDVLRIMGNLYYQLGQENRAKNYFQEAIQSYNSSNSIDRQAKLAKGIAEDYIQLNNPDTALLFYQQAISYYQQLSDYKQEAFLLRTIGELYYKLEEINHAIAAFSQATNVYQNNGDRPGEAWTLYEIGKTYIVLGDLEKALISYQQSLEIYQQEPDAPFQERRTVDIFIKMSQLYSYLEQPDRALQFCQQSLHRATEIPESKQVRNAEILREIGKNCYQVGDKQTALDSFNRYWNIYQTLGVDREIISLVRIGENYTELGDGEQALVFFNKARSLAEDNQLPEAEITVLKRIGTVYLRINNHQQALALYDRGLQIAQRIDNAQQSASLLKTIGDFYNQLNDADRALEIYNQSLNIYQTLDEYKQHTQLLNKIAELHQHVGEPETALSLYQQALTIAQDNGLPFSEILKSMARLYYQQGELDKALGMFQEYPNPVTVYDDMGKIYFELGEWDKAEYLFNQSLLVGSDYSETRAQNHFYLAKIEQKWGNFEQSSAQIETAIGLIEQERTNKKSLWERQFFFADKQDYYQFYIDLLMERHQQYPNQGYDAQALTINERSKARSLLELLSEANTDIRKGVNPDLVLQERRLQQQLNTIEQQRVALYQENNLTLEEKTAIALEREYLLSQYQNIQAQIRKTSPSYAALTQPQPLTFPQIQQQIVEPDTILLQYSLGAQKSYLWIVTSNQITSYILPPKAEIEAAVQRFRHRITRRRMAMSASRLSEDSAPLYQMLLAPVAEEFGASFSDRRLAIVADGILQYLPFAALSVPAQSRDTPDTPYTPLIANHEIVNLPSASTLAILRRETQRRSPAPKTLALFADPVFSHRDNRLQNPASSPPSSPPSSWANYTLNRAAQPFDIGVWERLPGTRDEAEAILSMIPESQSRHAVDFAANRAAAIAPHLNQYKIIHFATHGLLNSVNPELSGIILSMVDEKGNPENGFLRLHDVFNLDLAAELVVLSACETGLGQQVRGEGLVGLTRGFMYAGTPRVLVSLWNVDDRATAEMMTRFYRLMLTEKRSAAEALRAAQWEMYAESQWKSPYYWAGFTLQGEWRKSSL